MMVMRLWPPLGPGGKRGMDQRSLGPERRNFALHASLAATRSSTFVHGDRLARPGRNLPVCF